MAPVSKLFPKRRVPPVLTEEMGWWGRTVHIGPYLDTYGGFAQLTVAEYLAGK